MTNIIAQMLCDATQEALDDERIHFDWMVYHCDCCPATATCSKGHCGYEDWVRKWLADYFEIKGENR